MAFEVCHKVTSRVSSLALVHYWMNDYSVPTRYGYRDVLVKGFDDEVFIFCDGVEIAGARAATATATYVAGPRSSKDPVIYDKACRVSIGSDQCGRRALG